METLTNATLPELRAKRELLQAEINKIDEQITNRVAATIVRCPNKDCLRGYEVRELDYIQTHVYDPPVGCTDGDRWHPGEGQWKCPVCKTVTRLYDKPDIVLLKHHFRSILDTYDRS